MRSNKNNRIYDELQRDIFVLEDEGNPSTSNITKIYPPTVLDQVFDHLHPNEKNLREILDDIRQDINNGGIGNIVFPVTSVNGKAGDIIINKADVGLGRSDNTKDVDKPLSTPQRNSVMDILATYNFNINLDDLWGHLIDYNNPHRVTIEQLNDDGAGGSGDKPLDDQINLLIGKHNTNTSSNTHFDIRRSLSTLWNRVDYMDENIESVISKALEGISDHYDGIDSHIDLFDKKEDLANKTSIFTKDENSNNILYPSTKAVVNYVESSVSEIVQSIPKIDSWLSDIKVVNTTNDLPPATKLTYMKVYFLRRSPDNNSIQTGVAVCRKTDAGEYYWDISRLGSISSFDEKYFLHRPGGLTLDMNEIVLSLLEIEESGSSGIISGSILDKYVTYDDGDLRYIKNLSIITGDMEGCLKYYTNGDMSTMSQNIRIAGLHKLAFKEFVTEHEIREEAVHNRHLLSRSVDGRVLAVGSVDREHLSRDLFTADKNSVLGNIFNDDGTVESIDMLQLADILRPMIGGYDETQLQELFPHKWEQNVLLQLKGDSYGMRFTGTISILPNIQRVTVLTDVINSKEYQIIDAGGTIRIDSELEIDAPLGGTNLTGHTYAAITLDKDSLKLGSMSIGNRIDAPYDIWVRFVHRNVMCVHDWQYILDPDNPNVYHYVCSKCGEEK